MIPADSSRSLPPGSAVGFQPDALAWENLKSLNEESLKTFEKKFYLLTNAQKIALIKGLKRHQQTAFARLARHLAEVYYLVPEVARAIGSGHQVPFPEGYSVEEGDLSLLEPVYLRGRIYREI